MLGKSAQRQRKEPLGKATLSVELWATGKIEATPYGTFAKMMNRAGGSAEGSPSAAQSATARSHIAFDHYAFPKGKAALEEEMPRGKRVYPSLVYSDPARVFGRLPQEAEREVAAIQPPENRRPRPC